MCAGAQVPLRPILLEDTLRSFTRLICGSGLLREMEQSEFRIKHFSMSYLAQSKVTPDKLTLIKIALDFTVII